MSKGHMSLIWPENTLFSLWDSTLILDQLSQESRIKPQGKRIGSPPTAFPHRNCSSTPPGCLGGRGGVPLIRRYLHGKTQGDWKHLWEIELQVSLFWYKKFKSMYAILIIHISMNIWNNTYFSSHASPPGALWISERKICQLNSHFPLAQWFTCEDYNRFWTWHEFKG